MTLRGYEALRDRHILPRLGHLQLRAITPERLQTFQSELRADGVGNETIRRTLAMLQGMLERARNGAAYRETPSVKRKPRQSRTRAVEPLSPMAVERLRRYFVNRRCNRDATLISVLAYAGLRPGETLALRWGDVREQTLVMDKAVALGKLKETKTGRSRSVRVLAPLAANLAEWRLASGRPDDAALIFPDTRRYGVVGLRLAQLA